MIDWHERRDYWDDDHGSELFATVQWFDDHYAWRVRFKDRNNCYTLSNDDMHWQDGECASVEEARAECDKRAAVILREVESQ